VSGLRCVESTAVLQNVRDHSCSNTASQAGKPESSATLPEEPQISHILFNSM